MADCSEREQNPRGSQVVPLFVSAFASTPQHCVCPSAALLGSRRATAGRTRSRRPRARRASTAAAPWSTDIPRTPAQFVCPRTDDYAGLTEITATSSRAQRLERTAKNLWYAKLETSRLSRREEERSWARARVKSSVSTAIAAP